MNKSLIMTYRVVTSQLFIVESSVKNLLKTVQKRATFWSSPIYIYRQRAEKER